MASTAHFGCSGNVHVHLIHAPLQMFLKVLVMGIQAFTVVHVLHFLLYQTSHANTFQAMGRLALAEHSNHYVLIACH